MLINAVLFDLDGTLADTARDLFEAVNLTLAAYAHPPLFHYPAFRETVAYGTRAMLAYAFHNDISHSVTDSTVETFLDYYQQCLGQRTILFSGMNAVLDHLDSQAIPWGVVTSKLARFTLPLLEILELSQRTQCIVTGDALPYLKPHPGPLLQGCQLLKRDPQYTLYVGDYIVDVKAARAACMSSIIITNYYHHPDENPYEWDADHVVKDADELLALLKLVY